MSLDAMKGIWKNRDKWLQGSRRLVLLALADHANAQNKCWPSIDLLAKKTQLCKRYVIDILNDLERKGYIIREQREGTSTLYTLMITSSEAGRTSEVESTEVVSYNVPGSEAGRTEVVRQASPESLIKPTINQQEKPSISSLPAENYPFYDEFEHELQKEWNIKQKILELFNLSPDWNETEWRVCLQSIKAVPDIGKSLDIFANWWKTQDWRGKDGFPPDARFIIGYWQKAMDYGSSAQLEKM